MPVPSIADILEMLGISSGSYEGVSPKTKKALIESGAMVPEDFTGATSAVAVPSTPLGADPTQQVTQQEWERRVAKQKAERDRKYQEYLQRRSKGLQ